MNKINILLILVMLVALAAVYFLYYEKIVFPDLSSQEISFFINSQEISDTEEIDFIKKEVELVREISDKDERERYGISSDSDVFKVKKDETEYYLYIGKINPHNSGVYVSLNGKIYLFTKQLSDIIHKHKTGGKR